MIINGRLVQDRPNGAGGFHLNTSLSTHSTYGMRFLSANEGTRRKNSGSGSVHVELELELEAVTDKPIISSICASRATCGWRTMARRKVNMVALVWRGG